MPRPVRPWFRFYVETFSDRKLRRLTPTQRWIWAAILGAARESPTPGTLLIADDIPMTNDELAEYADVKSREVGPALTAMARLGMVTHDDGLIVVCNWSARQFESDDVTKRTQNHRERSKERSNDVPSNVRRNAPEAETETDTEKDPQKTSSSSGTRKRATRLPDDWRPSDDDTAWQREHNITDLDAKRELDKFRDYWRALPGQRGTKLDWSLTWRNWLRRSLERQAPTGTAPRRAGDFSHLRATTDW